MGWGGENNWQPSRRANTPDMPGGTRGSAWFRRKGKAIPLSCPLARREGECGCGRPGEARRGADWWRRPTGRARRQLARSYLPLGRLWPTTDGVIRRGHQYMYLSGAANAGVTRGVWWVPQLAALDRRRAPWHDFSFFFFFRDAFLLQT